jgi:hypothetical protein
VRPFQKAIFVDPQQSMKFERLSARNWNARKLDADPINLTLLQE